MQRARTIWIDDQHLSIYSFRLSKTSSLMVLQGKRHRASCPFRHMYLHITTPQ